ncbi:MAG: hypothetical protein IJV36_05565 [Prevotella sp.]|nr:hypothetical protein [Prevotella sp.]
MKTKFPILCLMATLLVACSRSKPQQASKEDNAVEAKTDSSQTEQTQSVVYDPTDALSRGLKGKPQIATTEVYSTYESNGQLEEGNRQHVYETMFDERGHLTFDEWGNNYGYDADGNFYRGNHTYTRIQRGEGQRITKYIDEDTDFGEDNATYTFTYDRQGRLIRLKKNGSMSNFDLRRQYKGANLYPSSEILEDDGEGGYAGKTTINYRYSHFDEQGNWTERIAVRSTETTDYANEDYADSLHTEPRKKISEDIIIEKRTIQYYD